VYLDLVDTYWYYEDQGRETAAQEMVDFVVALADYARGQHPGFLVFPQNAAELALDYPDYLTSIDGIGQEDIYYGYPDEGDKSPPDFVAELERNLDLFVEAGKTVLIIGYTTNAGQIAHHYQQGRERGYIPFATTRLLDRLTVNTGFEPD
jgi:cysteinyl-tRNA synthetase